MQMTAVGANRKQVPMVHSRLILMRLVYNARQRSLALNERMSVCCFGPSRATRQREREAQMEQDLAALQGAHFSQQRCKRNSETRLQKSEALSLRVDVVEEAVVAKEVFVEVSITQSSLGIGSATPDVQGPPTSQHPTTPLREANSSARPKSLSAVYAPQLFIPGATESPSTQATSLSCEASCPVDVSAKPNEQNNKPLASPFSQKEHQEVNPAFMDISARLLASLRQQYSGHSRNPSTAANTNGLASASVPLTGVPSQSHQSQPYQTASRSSMQQALSTPDGSAQQPLHSPSLYAGPGHASASTTGSLTTPTSAPNALSLTAALASTTTALLHDNLYDPRSPTLLASEGVSGSKACCAAPTEDPTFSSPTHLPSTHTHHSSQAVSAFSAMPAPETELPASATNGITTAPSVPAGGTNNCNALLSPSGGSVHRASPSAASTRSWQLPTVSEDEAVAGGFGDTLTPTDAAKLLARLEAASGSGSLHADAQQHALISPTALQVMQQLLESTSALAEHASESVNGEAQGDGDAAMASQSSHARGGVGPVRQLAGQDGKGRQALTVNTFVLPERDGDIRSGHQGDIMAAVHREDGPVYALTSSPRVPVHVRAAVHDAGAVVDGVQAVAANGDRVDRACVHMQGADCSRSRSATSEGCALESNGFAPGYTKDGTASYAQRLLARAYSATPYTAAPGSGVPRGSGSASASAQVANPALLSAAHTSPAPAAAALHIMQAHDTATACAAEGAVLTTSRAASAAPVAAAGDDDEVLPDMQRTPSRTTPGAQAQQRRALGPAFGPGSMQAARSGSTAAQSHAARPSASDGHGHQPSPRAVYEALIKTPGALRPYGPAGQTPSQCQARSNGPANSNQSVSFSSPFAVLAGGGCGSGTRSAQVGGRQGALLGGGGGGARGGPGSFAGGGSGVGVVDMRAGVAGGRRRTNLTANPFMQLSSLQVHGSASNRLALQAALSRGTSAGASSQSIDRLMQTDLRPKWRI